MSTAAHLDFWLLGTDGMFSLTGFIDMADAAQPAEGHVLRGEIPPILERGIYNAM